MKLKTVTYGRKINDGDYGTYHLEVTVELEEGESGADALKKAREFVHKGLGITPRSRPKHT